MTFDPLLDSSAEPFTRRRIRKGLITVDLISTFSTVQAIQPVLPGDTHPAQHKDDPTVTELGFETSYHHPEMVKAVLTKRTDQIPFRHPNRSLGLELALVKA
jgi:hypothetical protein